MVGECRANHNLDIGIGLPDLLNGQEAVPTGRHTHIDEGQSIRSPCSDGLLHHVQTDLSLIGEPYFKDHIMICLRPLAEQRCP